MNRIFRIWLGGLGATTFAVVVCIAYIDRPVAEVLDRQFRHTQGWIWLDLALRPLAAAVLLSLLFLFACGTWAVWGGRLAGWARTPLLCSAAAVWATAAEIIFKRVFGRAWPDPTYVQNHLYGFHLLHGGAQWESFPSGTAAVSAAIMSVLWIKTPGWRFAGTFAVATLSAAVVICNYHWVSDVFAGAFLGVTIGWMTVRLPEALNWR
jgi:membrane-associated phospholipid phosphatase